MWLKPQYFVLLSAALGAAAALAVSPVVAADETPRAGDQNAADTIYDLEAEGYNVGINWVNGVNTTVPLYLCTVTAIHNPDISAASRDTFTTVYVDVSCPNYWDVF
jgi:hypothetical protein